MRCVFISYDLRAGSEAEYEAVADAIARFGDCTEPTESFWILAGDSTPLLIARELWTRFPNGRFVVGRFLLRPAVKNLERARKADFDRFYGATT